MVKNNFMIKELLQNKSFVKQLELIAEELEIIKENQNDFSFFLPMLIINIESLLKRWHYNGSNTFEYACRFDDTKEEKISLQEEKKQKFEMIQLALEEYNKALDEYNKKMELYKVIEEIDGKLLNIKNHITEPEWKVWKEGHEMKSFEIVKKFKNK